MSLIKPGGKKQIFFKDGNCRIITALPNAEECVEEFDTQGLCALRKYRKTNTMGRQMPWDFEIGQPEEKTDNLNKKEVVTGLFAANDTPVVTRHDAEGFFLFRVTNMNYPEANFHITVEDNQLVVRTDNKKFYKKLRITDLEDQKIPLHESFAKHKIHQGNLVIFYQKPPGFVAFEKAARQSRKQAEEEQKKNPDQQCPGQ